MASRDAVYLFDALELADLTRLGALVADGGVVKVIQNADFERGVLGRYGIALGNVVDTLERSRTLRSRATGGHSLKAVCARELGLELDKTEQMSDWRRRPLTPRQLAYAALDTEVLLELYDVLASSQTQWW